MSLIEAKNTTARGSHDMVTSMMERFDDDASVQRAWASIPLADRVAVLQRARHIFAECVTDLCEAIPSQLARNAADTMCAEILPLLAAMKFLESEAETILAPRKLGRRGRPIWLMGVWSEVQRVPLGRVLVIAPSNYPLFLPGVQVLQALVAGNSVVWKPGRGGRTVATLCATVLREAGLPEGLLRVTDESVAAAEGAMASGVDKVFFTGSAASGKAVLRQLAETLTPCVAELSGCDAVFVLPSADLSRVVKALAFGMRLNGSATCMAPRRVILVGATAGRSEEFVGMLLRALDGIEGVSLPGAVRQELHLVVDDAWLQGAQVHGKVAAEQQKPIVITDVTPEMLAARMDIFAPILAVLEARHTQDAITMNEACPYALTAAVFGDEREALGLGTKITAGTVIVNDLMVPAADPRTPFGGRRSSGFGTTQGAEGLLEMTAVKTIAVRRGRSTDHYETTTPKHQRLFRGILDASHLSSWRQRVAALKQILSAANDLRKKN